MIKATNSFIRCSAFVLLALPLTGLGASTAQKERAAVLKATPDPVHGAELFGQCVSCHGTDGGGESNGSTPRIAGQHYRVLVKQLVDFRHGKRWDFRMESMADRHHLTGPQDIADVAAHVSNLLVPGKRGVGSGEFAAEGQRIYGEQCQSCHGTDGQGSEDGVPRLSGPALRLPHAADV